MTHYRRFAIYYVPYNDLFAQRGAHWLGYDNMTGRRVEQLTFSDIDTGAITQTPRKYGFHATIKAPFVLANDHTLGDLLTATQTLCSGLPKIRIELELSQLGRFFALTPQGDATALNAAAALVVQGLDQFRAPLTDQDIARRRKSNLSPTQDALMLKWGYPYVFDEFRFHMTLTGKVAKSDAPKVRARLEQVFSDFINAPLTLSHLAVLGETSDGMFDVIEQFPLSATDDALLQNV